MSVLIYHFVSSMEYRSPSGNENTESNLVPSMLPVTEPVTELERQRGIQNFAVFDKTRFDIPKKRLETYSLYIWVLVIGPPAVLWLFPYLNFHKMKNFTKILRNILEMLRLKQFFISALIYIYCTNTKSLVIACNCL